MDLTFKHILKISKYSLYLIHVLSVRPSVRIEQISTHRTDFHEMLFLSISLKTVEKIKPLVKI